MLEVVSDVVKVGKFVYEKFHGLYKKNQERKQATQNKLSTLQDLIRRPHLITPKDLDTLLSLLQQKKKQKQIEKKIIYTISNDNPKDKTLVTELKNQESNKFAEILNAASVYHDKQKDITNKYNKQKEDSYQNKTKLERLKKIPPKKRTKEQTEQIKILEKLPAYNKALKNLDKELAKATTDLQNQFLEELGQINDKYYKETDKIIKNAYYASIGKTKDVVGRLNVSNLNQYPSKETIATPKTEQTSPSFLKTLKTPIQGAVSVA